MLEQLRTAYVEKGWKQFYPQQFVAAGLGSEQSVVKLLLAFEESGLVCSIAMLRCGHDHTFWTGSTKELKGEMSRQCGFCGPGDFDEEDAPHVVLRFDLSPSWMTALDEARQKKKGSEQLPLVIPAAPGLPQPISPGTVNYFFGPVELNAGSNVVSARGGSSISGTEVTSAGVQVPNAKLPNGSPRVSVSASRGSEVRGVDATDIETDIDAADGSKIENVSTRRTTESAVDKQWYQRPLVQTIVAGLFTVGACVLGWWLTKK